RSGAWPCSNISSSSVSTALSDSSAGEVWTGSGIMAHSTAVCRTDFKSGPRRTTGSLHLGFGKQPAKLVESPEHELGHSPFAPSQVLGDRGQRPFLHMMQLHGGALVLGELGQGRRELEQPLVAQRPVYGR